MSRRVRREEYTIGWVCALPVELAAVLEMLDEDPGPPECYDNDENLYYLGSIAGHNVVVVCLPARRIGNNPAAAVATQMRATFKGVRFGLLVGIGGGVPSAEVDIRLGDVVVSQPYQTFGGVLQYDLGKATPSGFERTGSLNSSPQILLAAVARVRANELRGRSELSKHVSKLDRIPKFQRGKAGPDILFEATYDHEGGQTCNLCNIDRQEARQPRESEQVVVHYGPIASGNQVIGDGRTRNKLSSELGGVFCFEMEAAGLMNSFPCLMIRGICDYADSHKNKTWQAFAAGMAAAYAKEVLSVIPAAEVAKQRTVNDSMDVSSKRHLETVLADLAREKNVNLSWRESVVDLLKLLGLPSDLFTRELLADRLRIHIGRTGTVEQDEALYNAVMKELAANKGRVLSKIRECDTCGELGHLAVGCPNRELAKTQQAPRTAPELPGSTSLNEMQVAEPTFPLAQPPICLKCGCPGNLVTAVRLDNPIGNAGRPYYICSHGIQKSHTFITFDDNIGIIPGNPRCICGYISRLSKKRNGDGQFYSCPAGSCRFMWEGLFLPLRTMPMQTGANGMRMNISGSSEETESTRPSSTPADVSSFLVTELTDLLYEDNALNTLLSVALNDKSIREDKLQRNFRRVLIQYGRNLKDEAESEEHLAAASFVRHRSSLVSRNICQRVAGRLDDSRFKSLGESVERMEMLDKVDRFLKKLGNAPEETTMTPNWDEDVDDDIDMLHPYYESLTELSRVKQFLVSGNAFAVLRESLRDFINPSFQTRLMELIGKYWRLENKEDRFRSNGDQHSLIAELLDTDPSCIGWTGRDGTSWSDILKWKFEGWTREKWNWRPFKPPQRRLRPGEARLHWTCECGEQRWAEVPTDFARAVTRSARTCLTDSQVVAYPGSVQPPQASHLKQLPSSASVASVASSKVAEGFAKGAQAAGGSGSPSRNPPLGAGPSTNAGTPSSPLTSQRVFLLVAAGNGFRLAQIRVERLTTYEFFRELRQWYNGLRHFFRRWLSIWVYSHCDFYQCDKYEAYRYEPRREEFPDRKHHQNYQYEPNPMNLIPPIGPHEFYDRFHACYNPRPAFHFLHKCASFNKRTRDLLQLFPKCNSDLVEDSDKREPFWGIVAREQPSIVRLLLYNLACASPCLIFFFMWLFSWGHGGDLQNASVPLSVMLAALSIFWSIFFANLEFKQGNAKAGHRPS